MARMVMMVLCVVVACMVVAAPYAEAVVSCPQVDASLSACVGYLTGAVGRPSASCCTGILALNATVTTTADRQATCNCLQAAAGSISGINLGLAAGLPGRCGVNLPVMINASIDCSQVQ